MRRKWCIRQVGVSHGDDKGLVLPPRVASVQVVIVPIPFKDKEEEIFKQAEEIYKIIKKGGIRVQLDDKTNNNPGWKFNYWELKGVPIRLEIGPKDIIAQ
jgi:prolyl-tRNA synthetase